MEKKVIEVLERKFKKEDIKSRKGGFGKMLDYVEGHKVLQRLNEAFDGDYSIEIMTPLDKAVIDGKHVIVHARITVFQDGKANVIRDGIGGKTITNADLPSIYKAACTDAIKKAATTLGVALDLYGTDEKDDDDKEDKVIEKEVQNLPIQEGQKKAIETLVRSKKMDMKVLLAENKIDDLSKLTETQAKVIIENLQRAK